MVELGGRELPFGRLDAGPLETETECVEAEPGGQLGVLPVAVVEVAGVARGLPAGGSLTVLPLPPVAVDVATFDLVSRLRGSDQESGREPVD